jgi:hypothetical protein
MRDAALLAASLLSMAFAAPGVASAATQTTLAFAGVVTTGSGTIFPYESSAVTTSFDGQPITILLSITHDGADTYVDHFAVSWTADPHASPFIADWAWDGIPNTPENEGVASFFSTVSFNDGGGSISVFPTPGYVSFFDGVFFLNLTFATSGPYDPFSALSDSGVSGGGFAGGTVNLAYWPDVGHYDASSNVDFTLSSLTQTSVPEPATWVLMIAGFATVGAMVRRRAAAGSRQRC